MSVVTAWCHLSSTKVDSEHDKVGQLRWRYLWRSTAIVYYTDRLPLSTAWCRRWSLFVTTSNAWSDVFLSPSKQCQNTEGDSKPWPSQWPGLIICLSTAWLLNEGRSFIYIVFQFSDTSIDSCFLTESCALYRLSVRQLSVSGQWIGMYTISQ